MSTHDGVRKRSVVNARTPRVAVFGAGSIGCYLGGRLAPVADVTLVGRPAAMAAVRRNGLTLTHGDHIARHVPGTGLRAGTDPRSAAGADFVLITVKSADTVTAARDLAPHLGPRTIVCSLQNGVHNARVLRDALPGHTVLAGMVPYNVAETAPGHFHQGSGGALMLDATDDGRRLAGLLSRADLEARPQADMRGVQYAKLLMNLNNALNGLSGLPLRDQLEQRAYRSCLALCQQEALAAYQAAGIVPARLTPVPPSLTPALLRLPDRVFRTVARRSLLIDAKARSSLWDDLERGRRTEIDQLQGEVVALARRHGLSAPACARVVTLVREAEVAEPGRRRRWSGSDLLAVLTAARRQGA
ncbi:2-dehydropantoate 2-reductase [Streptomyces sp. NPDC057675]|uniref:2-dehydropantoate 2-reductase n=1 Tax=Streptomyces sp. NPDC057675 TaxID=3346204 RepID=UPI003693E2EC